MASKQKRRRQQQTAATLAAVGKVLEAADCYVERFNALAERVLNLQPLDHVEIRREALEGFELRKEIGALRASLDALRMVWGEISGPLDSRARPGAG